MKKVFIYYIFLISMVNLFAQEGCSLIEQPLYNGCVYLNSKDMRLVIIDKIYSDKEFSENTIALDESNLDILNSFTYNSSSKFQYFILEYVFSDELVNFTKTEKTIISKKKPKLNKLWNKIDFMKIDFDKKNINVCKKNKTVNQIINLKGNRRLLITNENNEFKISLELNCDIVYFEEKYVSSNPKISIINNSLVFIHNGSSLFIIEINDG